MKKDKSVDNKDLWDEIIRSKLYDFEMDTTPDDWQAIVNVLHDKENNATTKSPVTRHASQYELSSVPRPPSQYESSPVPRLPSRFILHRKWYYAAAAISLFLLISGSYYFFWKNDNSTTIVADTIMDEPRPFNITGDNEAAQDASENRENGETEILLSPPDTPKSPATQSDPATQSAPATQKSPATIATPAKPSFDLMALLPTPKIRLTIKDKGLSRESLLALHQPIKTTTVARPRYIADATPVTTVQKSNRRWTIGAGGGNYSIGTNGGGTVDAGRSTGSMLAMDMSNNGDWYLVTPSKRDDFLYDYFTDNANSLSEYTTTRISKVDMSHKQPISLGIGIGYALNNRWSLQSGLVYSLLTSEWSTVLDYQGKSKQQLHFIGIPLGVNYKIAEWNKIRFYTTAGGMAEWNVGGNIKTRYYFYEDNDYKTEKESIRMKEMQWSVNARVGATYPVIRFVNAYIEGGVNYYFDNKSSIESIRSDKPFHVSLQAGLRFGF